jgi:hypothetical protein
MYLDISIDVEAVRSISQHAVPTLKQIKWQMCQTEAHVSLRSRARSRASRAGARFLQVDDVDARPNLERIR